MSRTSFRMNLHSIVTDVKEFLARSRCHIRSLNNINGIRTHNHLFESLGLNPAVVTLPFLFQYNLILY